MKKSDVLIIVLGIVIAGLFLAALVYIAANVNTANAGLHFTF